MPVSIPLFKRFCCSSFQVSQIIPQCGGIGCCPISLMLFYRAHGFQQIFKKHPERFCVKEVKLAASKCAVINPYTAEICSTFTCRCKHYCRVFLFRWKPRSTPSTVLLEMAFIDRPYLQIFLSQFFLEFFYMPSATPDPPWQLPGVAFSDEIPTY